MTAERLPVHPRQSVAFRLGTAMVLILVVAVIGTIFAAGQYGRSAADQTFDRLLRGAALQIAERVMVTDGAADVDLPVSAFELLSLARSDRVFYRITRPDGATLTGYGDLPMPDNGKDGIYDARYKGVPVRAILLTRRLAERSVSGAVGIIVAQTTRERAALARSITTQAVLIIAGAGVALLFVALLVVRIALRPLARVERAILQRDVRDLSPINVPAPAEVSVLLEAINRFMGRLNRRINAMQNLVADAAHQLRTPITAMRAQAQLALDETDPERLKRLHQRLYQRSVGLSRLTDQLLSHALVAHRADSEALEVIDARRVAIEAEREMRASTGDSMVLELPDETVWIRGDLVSLREAVKNLVYNGFKHGGAPVRLLVSETQDTARIAVCDNGQGFDANMAGRIGTRFGSNGVGSDSAGLGLSIVSAVAASHHAGLTWHSIEGGGFEIGLDFKRVTP